MSPATTISALRAQLLTIVAASGTIHENLQVVEETLRNPSQSGVDAIAFKSSLDDAQEALDLIEDCLSHINRNLATLKVGTAASTHLRNHHQPITA